MDIFIGNVEGKERKEKVSKERGRKRKEFRKGRREYRKGRMGLVRLIIFRFPLWPPHCPSPPTDCRTGWPDVGSITD